MKKATEVTCVQTAENTFGNTCRAYSILEQSHLQSFTPDSRYLNIATRSKDLLIFSYYQSCYILVTRHEKIRFLVRRYVTNTEDKVKLSLCLTKHYAVKKFCT